MEAVQTESIEKLIDRCKKGDSSAFTTLYHLYSKEVYNTICRFVPHTGEAEDILQDVFVSAYNAIYRFEHTGGFRAWVKRIAVNHSITWIRKQKIRFTELEENEIGIKEEERIDESEFIFKVEEVKKAIEALPDSYRTIVQLYLIENIPQEEIAQMLGISHNNVRTQYHRAKHKILKTLKEGGVV